MFEFLDDLLREEDARLFTRIVGLHFGSDKGAGAGNGRGTDLAKKVETEIEQHVGKTASRGDADAD